MKKSILVKIFKVLFSIVLVVVVAAASFSVYMNVVFTPIVVSGLSMYPNLE